MAMDYEASRYGRVSASSEGRQAPQTVQDTYGSGAFTGPDGKVYLVASQYNPGAALPSGTQGNWSQYANYLNSQMQPLSNFQIPEGVTPDAANSWMGGGPAAGVLPYDTITNAALQYGMRYEPKDDFMTRMMPMILAGVGGAGMMGMLPGTTSIFGGGGGLFGGGAVGFGSADAAGLAQMAADAGLTGPAAQAFISSGGTLGSTIAGGGGVLGAADAGIGQGNIWQRLLQSATSPNMPGSRGGSMGFQDILRSLFAPQGTGTGGGSSMLGDLWNVGSGIYGLIQANQLKDLAARASQMQDPFGPYRGQYATELSALYADPTRIERLPGYKAGLNAVERTKASQGYLGSGNMMAALSQYGGDFFDKEVGRLSTLAGAQFPPSGGNTLMTGNIAGTQLIGQALNRLGYGLMGGGNSPTGMGWPWILYNS